MADPRPHDGDGPEEMDLLSATVVLYAAMLGATIAGQIAGIAVESLVGAHSIGVPLGCSVVLEAAAGARLGAAKNGGPLTPRQAGRISATYSAALLAISVPLLGWMEVSRRASGGASTWTAARVGAALALLVVATLARWGLMTLLGRLSRARSAR
ncbi:MAG: hypothetical protein ACRENE_01320 [Polyangiaceae bacterium]